jgi:hypothetical protein
LHSWCDSCHFLAHNADFWRGVDADSNAIAVDLQNLKRRLPAVDANDDTLIYLPCKNKHNSIQNQIGLADNPCFVTDGIILDSQPPAVGEVSNVPQECL